jgi:hypothetical protein
MRRLVKGAIFSGMLLCSGWLHGARPFATDDVGTVEPGLHELEFGVDFWSEEATLGMGFKHGLTDRMDLGVGIGHTLFPEEDAGFGNLELGMKFAVIPAFVAFSVAGSFGHEAYVLNGIITRNIGPVEINANFGYETAFTSDGDGTVTYALAAILAAGSYAFGVEGLGDKDGLQYWLVGGRYSLYDGLALDAGLAGGFEDDAAMILTVGVHYEF